MTHTTQEKEAMTASRYFPARSGAPSSLRDGRMPLHQYYVPGYKAKTKSRANALVMEFLSRVFASDGASRFFKTFLLRFLFDSSGKSSEDCSGSPMLAPVL